MATSHPCNITLKDSIIYFEFLKVNLPDSNTNKFGSNGFVHFRLLPVATIKTGSTIFNKASIYFDYNKPVVTNNASTFITPFGLPVIISNYTVNVLPATEGVKLNAIENSWSTSSEVNTNYYNIQRSMDGIHFYTIGLLTAKGVGNYHYIDSVQSNFTHSVTLFYRLQMVDNNGQLSYSETKQVTIKPVNNKIIIYPNPAKNFIMVKGIHVSEINVLDKLGRTVQSVKGLNIIASENKINMNVADGIYMLQVIHNDGTITNEKLIIKQ